MSQANVDVVRALWDAWERGDMAAVFDLYDPEIVWDQTHYGSVEIGGLYHGHAGVRQGGRGKGSGAEVEMPPYWQIFRLRDGLIVRVEPYEDEWEAFTAVGRSAAPTREPE